MYKFLLIFLFSSVLALAQDSEPTVEVKLSLQPVMSMYELADGWIQLVSTERVALRYSEREILLPAGAWRFRPDLDWDTFLQLASATESGERSAQHYTRVVSRGLFRVDLLTGELQPVDYLEVSICD